MKRAGLYVRVSTAEQKKNGYSVDAQIAALTDWCNRNGYEVADIYNDAGVSAHIAYKRRKGMMRMIKDCQDGKLDMIVMTLLDRFFRSVPDYYFFLDQINGVPWHTILEKYNTDTSDGRLRVNIMLSVAQNEAEKDSDRQRQIVEYRDSLGHYVGTAPIGYVLNHETHLLEKDPETSEGIAAFFRAILDLKTLEESVMAAKKHGISINRNHAYYILKNPAYMGIARASECPQYITEEEYLSIRNRLRSRMRAPGEHRTYLFHGLVRCGRCGCRMSASGRKRYSDRRGEYLQIVYQCRNNRTNFVTERCTGKGINEDIVESLVLQDIDQAINAYNVTIRTEAESADAAKAEKDLKRLKAKLDRLVELYTDGDISKEDYAEKRDALKMEMLKIKASMAPETKEKALPEGWRDVYNDLTVENKATFWKRVIKNIYILPDRKIRIEL